MRGRVSRRPPGSSMNQADGPLSVLCAEVADAPPLPAGSELRYVMGRCEKRMRHAVERCGGQMVGHQGRCLMAFFTDDLRALQSAVEIQHRIADLPPTGGFPLAARVGVCAGHRKREEPYFPGAGLNPAAWLSAVADQGEILISMPRRVRSFSWSHLLSNSIPELTLNCGKRRLGVFQVPWQSHDPATLGALLRQRREGSEPFSVHHRHGDQPLEGKGAVMRIGRHQDCELNLGDLRVSRFHGKIERRPDQVVLVDHSRNGTFVTFEGQAEFFLHHQELILAGRGCLSFGMSCSAAGAEPMAFAGTS